MSRREIMSRRKIVFKNLLMALIKKNFDTHTYDLFKILN